jgi:hypothetical protein
LAENGRPLPRLALKAYAERKENDQNRMIKIDDSLTQEHEKKVGFVYDNQMIDLATNLKENNALKFSN